MDRPKQAGIKPPKNQNYEKRTQRIWKSTQNLKGRNTAGRHLK
jgi:hypothetical protein